MNFAFPSSKESSRLEFHRFATTLDPGSSLEPLEHLTLTDLVAGQPMFVYILVPHLIPPLKMEILGNDDIYSDFGIFVPHPCRIIPEPEGTKASHPSDHPLLWTRRRSYCRFPVDAGRGTMRQRGTRAAKNVWERTTSQSLISGFRDDVSPSGPSASTSSPRLADRTNERSPPPPLGGISSRFPLLHRTAR